MTTHPQPAPIDWPNPWSDETTDPHADADAPLTGHDVPTDTNGLQISMARYLNYLRERRVQTEARDAA